jgi:hypothetical protein
MRVCRKRSTATLPLTEAEYTALVEAANEAVLNCRSLNDLNQQVREQTIILQDNQNCTCLRKMKQVRENTYRKQLCRNYTKLKKYTLNKVKMKLWWQTC